MDQFPWVAKFDPSLLETERITKLIHEMELQNQSYSTVGMMPYNFTSGRLHGGQHQIAVADAERRHEIGELFLNPVLKKELLGDIPYLVSAWFSVATQARSSTNIRAALMRDCQARPELCKEVRIIARQAPQCFSQNQDESGGSIGCKQTESGFEAYNRSIFCFQPPGDGVARKGYFDAIAVGCIPVIFAHMYGRKGWQWYFGPDTDHQLAIYVNKHYLISNMLSNIVDLLASIPIEEIYKRQAEIEKVVPSLLYSIPPEKYDPFIGYGGSRTELDTALGQAKGFSPPVRDAVDILLDASAEYARQYKLTGEIPMNDLKHTMNDGYMYWYSEDNIH